MTVRILHGDCRDVLKTLSDESAHCVVTSPPYYGLRDYGHDKQIGFEQTPAEYVEQLVQVFREVRRVLRGDGTLWLNLGDSYASSAKGGGENNPQAGLKPKDLIGIPWRVALALQADGWYLRQDIIWHKPNPIPESVRDRCTKAHEYIFMLAKSEQYYYDYSAMAEKAAHAGKRCFLGPKSLSKGQAAGMGIAPSGNAKAGFVVVADTRNKRSVWTVPMQPFRGAHFATFPPALIEPCILAGRPEGGTVLDPFGGTGTTGLVAARLHRNAVLIELNQDYVDMARRRITDEAPLLADVP